MGYDDDGVALGAPEDNNRLFLNSQTWAIIAGAVPEERMLTAPKNLKKLEIPFGPALLERPFDDWDPRWGRISIKKSGTTESDSVYCHASMFKAYSDAVRGNGDAVYEITISGGETKGIVNGQPWDGEYLPYAAGKTYKVEISC